MAGGLKRGHGFAGALGAFAALAIAAPASALADGSVSGTVTETAGGTGVGNYEVEIWSGGTQQTQVCTQGNGTFTTPTLPAGTYQVHFSGDGGTCAKSFLAPEWWNSFSRRTLALDVVIANTDVGGIDASLEDGAEVHGLVTDSLAAPVQNVTVDLIDVDGFTEYTACTQLDGTYTMDPVPPGGVYTVRFSPSSVACGNAGPYAIQWYNHAPTQNAASIVVVDTPGLDVRNIDGTMLAPVNLTVATAGSGAGTVTANRGGISCPGVCGASLAPGTVVDLTAQPAAGSDFTGWSGGGCAGTAPCQLTMNGDQTVTATFEPEPAQPPGDDPTDPTEPTDPGDPGNPPSSGGAPNTKIDQAKVKAKGGKATFAFSGSGGTGQLRFECSLVKTKAESSFEDCASPATYKRLKKGKYRFEVRARGGDGAIDQSPATQTFKSKRKKRK